MQLIQSIPVGARYMIMSAFGFSLMGVFVKLASQQHIPILEIVAARSVVSLVLSYLDIRHKNIPMWGQRKGLLISRGLAGAVALVCVYYALVNIPFAEATVIQYLHPMFTALLALLFLGERLRFSTVLCVLLSFIGLLLIVQPAWLFDAFRELLNVSSVPVSAAIVAPSPIAFFTIMIAITGAFGSALAYVIVRKLSQTEDSSVIILYFPLVALPLALLLPGETWVMPSVWGCVCLLMVGVFTQVGQIGLTKAMQTESAGRATSFSYLQVVFAVGFGLWVFNEIPTLWTLLGAAFILLGAFVNVSFGNAKKA